MEPEPELRPILRKKRPRQSAFTKAFETNPSDQAELLAELSAGIRSVIPEVGPDAVKFVDGPFFFVDAHGEMTIKILIRIYI